MPNSVLIIDDEEPIAWALRRAFDLAMKDAELLREAGRQTLEINPVKGEELDALSARIAATPADVAQRLRRVLDPANSGK